MNINSAQQCMASSVPAKAERQGGFIALCKQEGLSSKEIVERASVFPAGARSRVLKWPKI